MFPLSPSGRDCGSGQSAPTGPEFATPPDARRGGTSGGGAGDKRADPWLFADLTPPLRARLNPGVVTTRGPTGWASLRPPAAGCFQRPRDQGWANGQTFKFCRIRGHSVAYACLCHTVDTETLNSGAGCNTPHWRQCGPEHARGGGGGTREPGCVGLDSWLLAGGPVTPGRSPALSVFPVSARSPSPTAPYKITTRATPVSEADLL